MKHFDSCRCEQCRDRHPQHQSAPYGYLMQQIVSEGRLQEHCRQFCLSLSPLPRILMPPYSICAVRTNGDIVITPDGCGSVSATIPLSVIVNDQQGNSHTAAAQLSLCIPMRSGRGDAAHYIAKAQVSLCRQCVCFEDSAQVSVCLSVCIQVFGVQLMPMYAPSPCAPVCPDLPIYPQPFRL